MGKKFIGNAFSLQMIKTPSTIHVEEVRKDQIFEQVWMCEDHVVNVPSEADRVVMSMPHDLVSVIGHDQTAKILNVNGLKANRVNIKLEKGDILYVAQLMGGRLPEGATTLPKEFTIKYLKVTIE